MANNRMYMRCKKCGAILFLGKRLGDSYWYEDYPDGTGKTIPLKRKLNDFFEKHCFCNDERKNHINDIEYIDTPLLEKEEEAPIQDNFEICYEIDKVKANDLY